MYRNVGTGVIAPKGVIYQASGERIYMDYRIEHDSMGEVKVPADKYWAAQTERSHENFLIGVGIETMPREITHAFGILKKAAALSNHELKPERMTDKKLEAISQACDEVISGSLNDHFRLLYGRQAAALSQT